MYVATLEKNWKKKERDKDKRKKVPYPGWCESIFTVKIRFFWAAIKPRKFVTAGRALSTKNSITIWTKRTRQTRFSQKTTHYSRLPLVELLYYKKWEIFPGVLFQRDSSSEKSPPKISVSVKWRNLQLLHLPLTSSCTLWLAIHIK